MMSERKCVIAGVFLITLGFFLGMCGCAGKPTPIPPDSKAAYDSGFKAGLLAAQDNCKRQVLGMNNEWEDLYRQASQGLRICERQKSVCDKTDPVQRNELMRLRGLVKACEATTNEVHEEDLPLCK